MTGSYFSKKPKQNKTHKKNIKSLKIQTTKNNNNNLLHLSNNPKKIKLNKNNN